jgi:2-oxo-4-hydroxy-4-carboxy-5-ureidoimidazoline decarboxylase
MTGSAATKLNEWNELPEAEAREAVMACCGSRRFASELAALRPIPSFDELVISADKVWWSLGEQDWLEAFACHPRIGEPPVNLSGQHGAWSEEEQSGTRDAKSAVLESIFVKNRAYEARHGFIYIVCASGKPAEELLSILERRLGNSPDAELREAAEQQRQITYLRFRKWLGL